MASLNDLFTGTPPTYGVNVVGGGKSPFYGPAQDFGKYLMGLLGQPLPSYGGKIDPGMSPTLAALGQMMQGYSQSPLPGVMGQSAGVLGRFMNPSFANPYNRMGQGFPNYFGSQPGGGFMGGGGGMTNPFMGGQNPFGPGQPTNPFMGGQNPFGPPPGGGIGVQPSGPISGERAGGMQVQPSGPSGGQPVPPWMQPPGGLGVVPSVGGPSGQPTALNGGGLMGGGNQSPPWVQYKTGDPNNPLGTRPSAPWDGNYQVYPGGTRPPGGGMGVSPLGGGPSVSSIAPPPPPTSMNGGGFMGPGGNMTNAAMPNKQIQVDAGIPGTMRAAIPQEVPQSMAGRMQNAAPPPPPLRPGQMTRQQWIDAGMTPGPRGSNIKNIKMAKKALPRYNK